MALPNVEKTWYYKVNQALPSSAVAITDYKKLIWAIKDSLCTAAGWTNSAGAPVTHSHPWIVTQSSSGAGAFGNSDLWVTYANLIWDTQANNHSWITMRNDGYLGGTSAPMEVTIECISTSISDASVGSLFVDWRGCNANGAAKTRPTMTASTGNTETTLMSATSWTTAYGAVAFSGVLHVMMSSDGKNTRIFFTSGTVTNLMWIFDEPGSAVTGSIASGFGYWEFPAIAAAVITTNYTIATITDATPIKASIRNNAGTYTNTSCYGSTIFYYDNSILEKLTVPNDLTGEYPIAPIGIIGATPGVLGRLGIIKDMWFGLSTLPTGDTYPADGTRQFAHFNSIVVPWNSTAMLVTP